MNVPSAKKIHYVFAGGWQWWYSEKDMGSMMEKRLYRKLCTCGQALKMECMGLPWMSTEYILSMTEYKIQEDTDLWRSSIAMNSSV